MNDLQTNSGPSLAQLVSGIASDVQELIKQQFALLRCEIREGSRRAAQAALLLAVGAGVLGLGVILLCFMLVHLLAWAAPALPLWVCYCIVGVMIGALGGALVYTGICRFRSAALAPDQSAEALKENLRWLRNPK